MPSEPAPTSRAIAFVANTRHRAGPTRALPRLIREFEPFLRQFSELEVLMVGGSHRSVKKYGLLSGYDGLQRLAYGSEGGLVELTASLLPSRSSEEASEGPKLQTAEDLTKLTSEEPEKCSECKAPLWPCVECGVVTPHRHTDRPACPQCNAERPACPVCNPLPMPNPVEAVFFLIDPSDHTSLTPGSQALERECVVNQIPFIGTYTGVREWLILRWQSEARAQGQLQKLRPYFLSRDQVARLKSRMRLTGEFHQDPDGTLTIRHSIQTESLDPAADLIPTRVGQKLALIAHTGCKDCIVRFAKREAPFLMGFDLIGTETTAKVVNQANLGLTVEPFRSGPLGGDVEIAEAIRRGNCQKVLFFEDPHYSRQHEADIRLLERMARSTAKPVFCLHDHASAVKWASMWTTVDKPTEYGPEDSSLVSISHAFATIFPEVDLILADPLDWEKPLEEDDRRWKRIISKAAPTLVGLIAEHAERRRDLREETWVGVSWRASIADLLRGIVAFKRELEYETGNLVEPRLRLAYRYVALANMVSVPLVGVRGEYDKSAEANEHAAALAKVLAPEIGPLPEARRLSVSAFASARNVSGVYDIPLGGIRSEEKRLAEEWWDLLDVAVFTATAPEMLGTNYVQLAAKAREDGAVGEVCGIFLKSDGSEVDYRDELDRIGISLELLRRVQRNGGALLVAGAQPLRVMPTLAALRAGIVSVLVTDLAFAWRVLRVHLGLDDAEDAIPTGYPWPAG